MLPSARCRPPPAQRLEGGVGIISTRPLVSVITTASGVRSTKSARRACVPWASAVDGACAHQQQLASSARNGVAEMSSSSGRPLASSAPRVRISPGRPRVRTGDQQLVHRRLHAGHQAGGAGWPGVISPPTPSSCRRGAVGFHHLQRAASTTSTASVATWNSMR
jgi:hypothetical protein